MYTQEDRDQIRGRIIKYSIITGVVAAALIACFVLCLIKRSQPLAMLSCCLLFSWICFMWCMFLYPCIRYRGFLRDMEMGLGREIEGDIVEISAQEDYQDGVRVLPVRIHLKSEDDERIVYLNTSKSEAFPKEGTAVKLSCYGRHIKEVLSAK